MSGLKTKFRQFRYRLKNDVFTLTHLSVAAILVIFVWWTASAISSMNRNWVLQRRLASRNIEKTKLEIEVETLKLEQEYLKSAEYQEYMARAKQNKMAPGETMVILPDDGNSTTKTQDQSASSPVSPKSNLRLWLEFLFG